jgi:2,3-bisphosphoglycerate-independent phosphoglycerate mutase
MADHRPVALIVLDGWGLAPEGPGNAVSLASTPNFDALWERFPHTTLAASGRDVGLPDGQMGNSEVGHLNLGAGRVVPQDLVRIDDAVADGSLARRPAVDAAMAAGREQGVLHLIGLVSDGGVHSHVNHLRALVDIAAAAGVESVAVHAFTDGRDVSPHEAAGLFEELEREWEGGPARFAAVCGRLYSMDRDHRAERTERARAAIVEAVGLRASSAPAAVRESYAAGVTDEFVEPVVLDDGDRRLRPGEPVFFFNFRPDRARQICHALAPTAGLLATMTRYDDALTGPVAFDTADLADTLADVLEREGLEQLHVAETEKYAHVTYFFNGGAEAEHRGEARVVVPSPRDVKTYDQAPEMSAAGVAEGVVTGLAERDPAFVVVNFANPDMVGHSGNIPATVRAVEAADAGLGRVLEAVAAAGGVALVTADHGNAERMLEDDGSPHTAHTTNPVPLILTMDGAQLRPDGRLGDIAPTVLDLLGLRAPAAMGGRSLLARA